jgi:hypothetical protein
MTMNDDSEAKEYPQFKVDLLNSKFKGTHTETQMIERLIQLCQKKNRYALRGVAEAKLTYAPDSRMSNSVWKNGAIYAMCNVASPSQTGPAGTDNFGLWRTNAGSKK